MQERICLLNIARIRLRGYSARVTLAYDGALMILSDNETKIDLLNHEAIAKTIVMLLREPPEHPVTIGVHGDWAAGRSSALALTDVGLHGGDRARCLQFNGCRYRGFAQG